MSTTNKLTLAMLQIEKERNCMLYLQQARHPRRCFESSGWCAKDGVQGSVEQSEQIAVGEMSVEIFFS